jgi:hypothetical protein
MSILVSFLKGGPYPTKIHVVLLKFYRPLTASVEGIIKAVSLLDIIYTLYSYSFVHCYWSSLLCIRTVPRTYALQMWIKHKAQCSQGKSVRNVVYYNWMFEVMMVNEWGKRLKEFSAKNMQKYIMWRAEWTAAEFELESKFVFSSILKSSTECHKEMNSETWLLSIIETLNQWSLRVTHFTLQWPHRESNSGL